MSSTKEEKPVYNDLRISALLLSLAVIIIFIPFIPWLILASWVAELIRPFFLKIARLTHGKHVAGALVTSALFVVIITPIIAAMVPLVIDAINLADNVMHSKTGAQALQNIVSQSGNDNPLTGSTELFDFSQMFNLIKQYGSRAWDVFALLTGVTATVLLGFFVFFTAIFSILIEGHHFRSWVEHHFPIPWVKAHFQRLNDAFYETGRGLFVGVGLTGLTQALMASIMYLILGVPRGLVLGTITFFASFIPTVGTALVWLPVTAGLALTDRKIEAIVLLIYGMVVVGSIDNIMQPVFARWGKLDMHWFIFLLSIFGGLALFGPFGILMGPLTIRMAVEVLRILNGEAQHDNKVAHK